MKKNLSPLPNKEKKQDTMDFVEAINQIKIGKKVRRLEWTDEKEYGLLKDTFLMIHRQDKFHQWIVSEGDMMAIDWVIIK